MPARFLRPLCVLGIAVLFSACDSKDPAGNTGSAASGLSGTVSIDGSSTVYLITEAVAEEFREVAPQVKVTVAVSGTGGGFKRFATGDTDVSNASRPIKAKEMEAAQAGGVEFIELPVAYDGLAIVVNKGNTWVDTLTVDELKKIFLDGSAAKTWADVREGWPKDEIKIFIPGTDSGTFDYFKEVVAGSSGSIRSDVSVSEDDNVLVRGITGEKNAIGFFGCAYYFENSGSLKAVPIDGGKGPVSLTAETVENGSYAPFSRPLFIYVNRKSADRPEVKTFVEFYLKNTARLSNEVGYVGLPEAISAKVDAAFTARTPGSKFTDAEGKPVHGSLAEIYK